MTLNYVAIYHAASYYHACGLTALEKKICCKSFANGMLALRRKGESGGSVLAYLKHYRLYRQNIIL